MDTFRNFCESFVPDREYFVMEDVDTDGILLPSIKKAKKEIFIFIPFCVIGYIPRYQDIFGVHGPELKEVHPFAQFAENVIPRDPQIVLPMNLDPKRKVQVAFNHIRGKYNHYNLLKDEDRHELDQICWDAAQEYLREHPGEIQTP